MDRIQDDFTCPVCMKLHKDPRTLSCRHSYCKGCLLHILASKSPSGGIVCRRCSLEDPLVRNEYDIDQLPKTIYMTNHAQRDSQEGKDVAVLCDVCDTTPPENAIKKCTQCSLSYCSTCLHQLHPNRGVLAKHNFVDPEFETSAPHEEGTCSYCEDCKVMVIAAESRHHQTHSIKSLTAVFKTRQEQLQSSLSTLQELREDFEIDYTLVGSTINNERENGFQAEDRLNSMCENLKKEIDKKRTAAISKLRDRVDSNIRQKQAIQLELRDRLLQTELCIGSLQPLTALKDVKTFLQAADGPLGALQERFPSKLEIDPGVLEEKDYLETIEEVRAGLSNLQLDKANITITKVEEAKPSPAVIQSPVLPAYSPGQIAAMSTATTPVIYPPNILGQLAAATCTYPVQPGRPVLQPSPFYPIGQPLQFVQVVRPVQTQPVATPQASVGSDKEPLTASMLAAATPQEKKQMLGERLFPLIWVMYPELAGKITGMFLEIDSSELLHLLNDKDALKSRVDEAVALLKVHQERESQNKSPE